MRQKIKSKVVKAWGFYNVVSGNLGVSYRSHPITGFQIKTPDLWPTRKQARDAGCDKPSWRIVPITITIQERKR